MYRAVGARRAAARVVTGTATAAAAAAVVAAAAVTVPTSSLASSCTLTCSGVAEAGYGCLRTVTPSRSLSRLTVSALHTPTHFLHSSAAVLAPSTAPGGGGDAGGGGSGVGSGSAGSGGSPKRRRITKAQQVRMNANSAASPLTLAHAPSVVSPGASVSPSAAAPAAAAAAPAAGQAERSASQASSSGSVGKRGRGRPRGAVSSSRRRASAPAAVHAAAVPPATPAPAAFAHIGARDTQESFSALRDAPHSGAYDEDTVGRTGNEPLRDHAAMDSGDHHDLDDAMEDGAGAHADGSAAAAAAAAAASDLGEAEQVGRAAEVREEVSDFDATADGSDEADHADEASAATGVGADAAKGTATTAADGDVCTEASEEQDGGSGGGLDDGSARKAQPSVAALLDVESPLNLRLATLTRQHGKAFRAIAVCLPENRQSMNFDITFEDIASGSRLECKLLDVKARYTEWIARFRASFVAIFVPTLQSPSATLLQNAINTAIPARAPLPPGSHQVRLDDDPDHLFFSYTKLREIISQKKKDVSVDPKTLTVTVLNAYAEQWKNFIVAPLSCAPQAFLLSAFNFQSQARDRSVGALLNKELLQAQLAAAADAMVLYASTNGTKARRRTTGALATSVAASSTGLLRSDADRWGLIFVTAPVPKKEYTPATPPMQDLLTGQFVEPLSLSERCLIYIIGTGTAAETFARLPLARKGKVAFSILLQDVEAQLGLERPHRVSVTAMLTQALDRFSRITWMGLMREETGEEHKPSPSDAFYRLQRRGVQREIMPSFLEPVFAPGPRFISGGGGGGRGDRDAPHRTRNDRDARSFNKVNELLEGHVQVIYNNSERLAREKALQEAMRGRVAYFMHVTSASVTAARRADNPFSARNGMVDVSGQLWSSIGLMNPPPVRHWRATVDEKTGEMKEFVDPEVVLPDTLPLGPPDAPDPKDRAESAVLIGWDLKRVLLFLRRSVKLRTFLYNGGKVWCAQYAQYLLKGFNHLHLATMERTLLQYHDGPLKGSMQPLAKLKLIYEMQLEVAVSTRQMSSVQHRMDGLLASMEMELQGLQIAPQSQVTYFANTLRLDHGRLEKVLQQKIMDFTQSMDDDVRQRINFRSPQDISTIIYGGGLCRHLGSRFVPIKPTRYPATSLFPHAVCHVTGTTVPEAYTQAGSLLGGSAGGSGGGGGGGGGSGGGSGGGASSSAGHAVTAADARRSLELIQQLCKRCTMDTLIQHTAVIVVALRVKMGGLVEQVSIYCPATTGPETRELNLRVAVDDVIPVTEHPDVVTITQLKARIAAYEPLQHLFADVPAGSITAGAGGGKVKGSAARRASGKKTRGGAKDGTADLRNLLVLTSCAHDRLEPLVDAGLLAAIKKTAFGAASPDAEEPVSLERVCFADVSKAFPPPPQGADSFESDFSELTTANAVPFSARATWESYAKELVSLGGVEGAVKSIVSQCASVVGTPRDAFRSSQPLPSSAAQGVHGQEQASTAGMLWMVTPENLHPLLRRFLRGRAASSGADAMERVTVLLSPYKTIDLSFFTALQQLRFTEKKLQLFEEGCLFRAVLPECHDRVHGELCHCVTATGRLSSQSPNLQNIPKEEDLRRLIVSRFGAQGMMIEADYSQLEVVVLAALSRDPRMMQELRDNVDFHCLRVSLMTKEPYEDVVRKAKVLKDPQYIQLRQQAKVFSFQRQYGAGVSTISTTTGLTEQEVDRLIIAEEHHYKELSKYYSLVTRCVEAGADRLLRLRTLDTATWNANIRRVVMLTEPMYYFVVPTGSKFDFAKDRKSVPRLKNYPVQGLAGEIVQIICGAIVREFYRKHNYGEKAFLVNTVHDCVWVDAHKSVADEVRADLARIMGHTQETIAALWPDMKLDVPFKAEIHSGTSLGELSL